MSSVSSLRRVLLLGSGYTSAPLVEWLTRDGTVSVTVASNIPEQADRVAAPFKNTSTAEVDVTSDASLSSLIPGHNLVISYVPFTLHPLVARQCIAHKVDLVTASYVSPELQELDGPAKEVGVTLLNEIGLDPGIDHMLAMQCIDEVHDKGGKVLSFDLLCGGLPAPECADNPLKYKFSWSPKGVLLGTMHPATYLKDGKLVEVPRGGDILSTAQDVSLFPDLPLEFFPNRDSVKYREVYQIPEASTIVRSTLRYRGFCGIAQGLLRLGLLGDAHVQRLQPDSAPLRWRDLLAILISQSDVRTPDLRSSVLETVGGDQNVLTAIEGLGLLTDAPAPLRGTPIDTLCAHLQERLQYQPGERDAIFMRETFTIQWPNRTKEQRWIDLVEYGNPDGYTAMARCVGLPTAIAARLILDG
ncbi:Alpha-aminoadipic semialdehyde synthase, mitochondrial, partial [Geodia barretti]